MKPLRLSVLCSVLIASTALIAPAAAIDAGEGALIEEAIKAQGAYQFSEEREYWLTDKASGAIESAYLFPEEKEIWPEPQLQVAEAGDPYHEIFARGLTRLSESNKAEHRILSSFYEAHDNRAIWWQDGAPSARALIIAERISKAAYDGLNAEDYVLPQMRAENGEPLTPIEAAVAEINFSKTVLLYARHIARGRIRPSSLSELLTLEPEPFDAVEALSIIASAQDVNAAVDALAPQHSNYLALKDILKELYVTKVETPSFTPIPEGNLLRPGMRDARVPLLRERFDITLSEGEDELRYSGAIVEAIETFQRENALLVDGVIGAQTIFHLNQSETDRIALVTMNMERWRWMPRDMGDFHVKVNIPEFTARIFRDGNEIHQTKAIVGQPRHQTPIFSDKISYLVINPYWHVPVSIARRDTVPKQLADPNFLASQGFEVFYVAGGRNQQVYPSQVNWAEARPNNFRFRQRPGPQNALGEVKFMFPNQHSVYLHDTPSRNLFNRVSRPFSSGCVRLENPFEFADVLLQNEPNWTGERVRTLRGGDRERTVQLRQHVPVHLMYFTAWADLGGELRVFSDVYSHDEKLAEALGRFRPISLQIAGDFLAN